MKKSEKEKNYVTNLCREVMNDVKEEDLQQIRKCLLTLCDLIEESRDNIYSKNLSGILEIIVLYITTNPINANLILDLLLNFDNMFKSIELTKTKTDYLLKMFSNKNIINNNDIGKINDVLKTLFDIDNLVKNKKTKSLENEEDNELNLFNPDGTRCSVDGILNSW